MTRCSTLQHTATHCNTLQHTATHCNTLQHTATLYNTLHHANVYLFRHIATLCNTLQHSTPLCNTLQHTKVYLLQHITRRRRSRHSRARLSRHARKPRDFGASCVWAGGCFGVVVHRAEDIKTHLAEFGLECEREGHGIEKYHVCVALEGGRDVERHVIVASYEAPQVRGARLRDVTHRYVRHDCSTCHRDTLQESPQVRGARLLDVTQRYMEHDVLTCPCDTLHEALQVRGARLWVGVRRRVGM